jgi:hypothetical protein
MVCDTAQIIIRKVASQTFCPGRIDFDNIFNFAITCSQELGSTA